MENGRGEQEACGQVERQGPGLMYNVEYMQYDPSQAKRTPTLRAIILSRHVGAILHYMGAPVARAPKCHLVDYYYHIVD